LGNNDIIHYILHPFYVNGRGWVAAGDLNEGDELCLESGETAYVTGTELEKLAEPITVYNLEVADYNTYFVGDNAVLVHNYNQTDIDNAINNVPEKCKQYGKCDDFADALTNNLQGADIPSQKILVTRKAGNNIFSDIYGQVGYDYHYGVLVDGKVYDNLNYKNGGMSLDSWLNDLGHLIGAIKYEILG
jgi:hypothetical protein